MADEALHGAAALLLQAALVHPAPAPSSTEEVKTADPPPAPAEVEAVPAEVPTAVAEPAAPVAPATVATEATAVAHEVVAVAPAAAPVAYMQMPMITPQWQLVVDAIDAASARLSAQANDVGELQTLLVQINNELLPMLSQVGPSGMICQQRLMGLMAEVGIGMVGAAPPPPVSAPGVLQAATQALAAIKQYSTTGTLLATRPRFPPSLPLFAPFFLPSLPLHTPDPLIRERTVCHVAGGAQA